MDEFFKPVVLSFEPIRSPRSGPITLNRYENAVTSQPDTNKSQHYTGNGQPYAHDCQVI